MVCQHFIDLVHPIYIY